mgnify:CR=1 FL=1
MDFDFRRYKHIYAADFETSTEAWNCEARVWLWDICDKDYKHRTGTSINYFMNYIIRTAYKCLYFFRNLAYDGSYIITWLFNNGYKHVNKKSDEMLPFEFHTVISDMGLHYAYEIVGRMGQHVTIMDSLKTVNMSIHDSAIMYDLPIKKGEIDYDKFREIGYKPTDEEIAYIHNDTEIDMRTIQKNIEMGGVKFTQAGNARSEFIKGIGKKNYDINFPFLQQIEETNIRKAYRGGYVYCNPKYQNRVIYNMMALDKNSMYPAQMLHEYMPHGFPMWYSGKYDDKYSGKYPIYIQHIKVSFELKPNAVPTIARRNGFLSSDNLYLNSSNGLMFDLWLANPDLELLYMCYDIIEIEYIEGYMFKAVKGIEITPNEAKNMDKFEIIDEDGKGSLFYDYIHKLSRTPILKAQHPDYEIAQMGIHGQRGVSCADCHMPYKSEGGVKFSDHHIQSPLAMIDRTCQVCHRESEETLRNNVYERQRKANEIRNRLEQELAKAHIEAKFAWDNGATEAQMKDVLALIRQAQWRWDFGVASHGGSFHAPQEIQRILSHGLDRAMQARLAVSKVLAKNGYTGDVPMPDISTKAKAQEYIGLDMDAERAAKEKFLKTTVPAWLEKAKANGRLAQK